MRRYKFLKSILLFTLLFAVFAVMALPHSASAREPEEKVVRVGWYDSSFCYYDQFGRRCGVDYEYQQKISAYTGWKYEYVEDSWSNLLQMLMEGKIDLLSDVSYKPERAELMLFPDTPMGAESYYIYTNAENRDITANHLQSFNGTRIGVNEGSIQESFLRDWAERNGLMIEIVPLDVSEAESMEMLMRGELDGYTTVYTFDSEWKTIPVCKVGSSEYYYAVNKNRPDLLADLNMALAGIQDEDPYFNQQIMEERLYTTRTSAFLTPEQEDWVGEHGAVRIGYWDGMLPFCETDQKTGELTGALKDYLAHAENSLPDSGIHFQTFPYETTDEALKALNAGEIDCVFPIHLGSYDAEQMDIWQTDPAMYTEMNAVIRSSDGQKMSLNGNIVFAVREGDLNSAAFLMEKYPAGTRKEYKDGTACLEAVASGDADCTLVSNYRTRIADDQITKNKLLVVPTGESMSLAFAVDRADPVLYFILNKIATMTRTEDMDAALASYMPADQKVTIGKFLEDNWLIVLLFITVIFIVILILLLQKLKAERTANEQKRLLEEVNEIADLKQTISALLDNMPGMNFTKDAKTGVYLACNQAFAEYAHKNSPEEVVGFTDKEIFDAETAKRFAEDDKIALSMDEPYIFFEDIPDPAGNQRQIKTTKQKYIDNIGRLCVLGIYQDVTDSVRISRERASTKESYEKARSTGVIFTYIAQALALGYMEIYCIDLNSEEFIEYRTDSGSGSLIENRRGWHFFEECQEEAERSIYPEDKEAVKSALDRKNLEAALERDNTFVLTYRLLRDNEPAYVSMRVTRMQEDERYVILGVMDTDEQERERNAIHREQEERVAYNRLIALVGEFLCIYLVDPQTGHYRVFRATSGYETLVKEKEGDDFYSAARELGQRINHPEDLNRFLTTFSKENILAEIKRHGIFALSYRIMIEGQPRYVRMKASMLEEKDGPRLIVGINDIDAQVRQEEEYVRHIAKARIDANIDPLTGVKNRHAYLMAEERLNEQLADNPGLEYAVVILDVNDLKMINDNEGHKAGDQYLKNACRIICDIFKHSPVFRIGGDEYAVIAQGKDYSDIDELVTRLNTHNLDAINNGGIVIACGMAKHKKEVSVAAVFERADQEMYKNKSDLKDRKQ